VSTSQIPQGILLVILKVYGEVLILTQKEVEEFREEKYANTSRYKKLKPLRFSAWN
jgi:hypothetical protein